MSTLVVIYEDALAAVGTLTHLSPHLTTTNICAMVVDLVDKLTIILSQQTPDFGYAWMIEADEIYSMKTQTAWVKWSDPGPQLPISVK